MTDCRELAEEEQALRERLGRAGSPPFLGHYAIPENAARKLCARVASAGERWIVVLQDVFRCWPALATAWIANHVRKCYGEADDQRFWPLLAELLKREVPPNERPILTDCFERACRRLEVAVASDGKLVDRLVVQAGAPLNQLDVLVRSLSKVERAMGLPDEDDDLACTRFASATAGRLRQTNPRLARILEADATAWYVRQWVLLTERPDQGDPEFQEALRQAKAQLPEHAFQASPPHLIWTDGELAIRVPPFRRGRLCLEGRRKLVIEPLERPELVSLAELDGGADGVRWAIEGSGQRDGWIKPPAPDGAEILLFEAVGGRLAGRARFEVAGATITVPPGRYVALAAGLFVGPDGPAEQTGPLSFAELVLGREPQALRRGSLELRIVPMVRPRLELPEPAFVALDGRAVHAGPDLRLRVWRERDGAQGSYELLVKADGSELGRVPVPAIDGLAETSLAPVLSTLPARLLDCRIALVLKGERRELARARALVWNRLEAVEDGRFAGAVPENLDRTRSLEIVTDENGVALRRDRRYAIATLWFCKVGERGAELELGVASREPLALIEDRDEHGKRLGQIVDPQQPIIVRPGDVRTLEIRCPNPAAELRIGERRYARAFRHGPKFRLSLVTAAEHCLGLEPTIEVSLPGGLAWPLARLTIPNEALAWAAEARPEADPVLAFRLREPVAALGLDARELLSGKSVALELVPDSLLRQEDRSGLAARLEPDSGTPPYAFRLVLARSHLPHGLWLFHLQTRDHGTVWRSPSNPRGDRFAWLVEQDLKGLSTGDLAAGLGLAGVSQLFTETHRALRRCYALPAWEQAGVRRLESWWRRSAEALGATPQAERQIANLLPLAFEDPPSDAAPSWVPILGFWQVFPCFLALPGALYDTLAGSSDLAARTLAAMAGLARAGSVARWATSDAGPTIDFLRHFANVADASRGGGAIELSGFDFMGFRQVVLRSTDPDRGAPERGWLAPAALVEAAQRFARRWRMVSRTDGYQRHRPAAMTVVRAAARWLNNSGKSLVLRHVGDLKGPLAIAIPKGDETEDALLEELEPAASAVALASRLEWRQRGTLEKLLGRLDEDTHDRARTLGALEFLWNLGRDSFAFWALFWEALLTTGDSYA